ncbi:hypothetical protein Bca4012_019878 [Brassica carinata]
MLGFPDLVPVVVLLLVSIHGGEGGRGRWVGILVCGAAAVFSLGVSVLWLLAGWQGFIFLVFGRDSCFGCSVRTELRVPLLKV